MGADVRRYLGNPLAARITPEALKRVSFYNALGGIQPKYARLSVVVSPPCCRLMIVVYFV